MKKPDIKTVNKGGRGFGVLNSEDRKFLTPDFDAKGQYGPDYVGKFNKVSDTPGRSDDE